MSPKKEKKHPDYENPPVIEVICGIQFDTIEKLLTPHIGLLWEKYKPDFPLFKELPPLVPVIEKYDEPTEPEFTISHTPPLPRTWLIQKSQNGIIQIQKDRFFYNWRKVNPGDEYPRYKSVIAYYERHLKCFEDFLIDNDLDSIKPLQYELSYINIIPKGEGWDKDEDISKIFRDFSWDLTPNRFLSFPDNFNWRTQFILPNKSGRMHIQIQKGFRKIDKHPIIRLELLVRGIEANSSIENMRSWFDQAHEWIVCGFADITSSKIQKETWRRLK